MEKAKATVITSAVKGYFGHVHESLARFNYELTLSQYVINDRTEKLYSKSTDTEAAKV